MSGVPLPRQGDEPMGPTAPHELVDGAALEELLSLTWSTFVDPEAEVVPVPLGAVADVEAVVAEIAVRGDSPILLRLAIDGDGARSVTEQMIGGGSAVAVAEEDVADAVGELANVLGGNIKALLPEGSHLTLPTVHGAGWLADSDHPDSSAADDVRACVLWRGHAVVATVSSADQAGADQLREPGT